MMDLWSNELYQEELENTFISEHVLENLYGKTVLITGATGMVCSFLVDALAKKNMVLSDNEKVQMILLVRNQKYAEERFCHYINAEWLKVICLDITKINNEFNDLKFHYIIAGAGSADPQNFVQYPVETMKSNFLGLYNLLEIAKNRKGIKVLYISSGEVYGNAGEGAGAFSEDESYYVNSMDVRACYPNSKRAAETLCVAYHKQYEVDVVVGRLCYIFGPTIRETDSRSVAQFLRKAATGEDIILKSLGGQVRSYCYVADAVSALLYLLICGQGGEAYNISSDDSNMSIAEFAHRIAKAASVNCVYEIPTEQEKSGYSKVERAVQSAEKLNRLGWKATKSLNVCIEKSTEILRSVLGLNKSV